VRLVQHVTQRNGNETGDGTRYESEGERADRKTPNGMLSRNSLYFSARAISGIKVATRKKTSAVASIREENR